MFMILKPAILKYLKMIPPIHTALAETLFVELLKIRIMTYGLEPGMPGLTVMTENPGVLSGICMMRKSYLLFRIKLSGISL